MGRTRTVVGIFLHFMAGLLLFLSQTGCGDVEAGCRSNDDCRTGRLCVERVCIDPDLTIDSGFPDGGDFLDTGAQDGGMTDVAPPPSDMPPPPPADMGVDMPPPPPDMGIGPQIEVTPTQIDYGNVPVGSSVDETLTVTNVGDATLTITSLDLQARPSQGFDVQPVIDATNPLDIPPGDSSTFTVTFSPTLDAQFGNAVVVESNDTSDPSVTVQLTGRGRTSLPQSCLFAGPDLIDFGTVAPGNSDTRTVTIGNCGMTEDVTVTQIEVLGAPGPFSASPAMMVPFTLTPGQQTTIDVTFTPSSLSAVTDVLEIQSDATIGSNQQVDLAGSGGGCPEAVALAENDDTQLDSLRGGTIPAQLNDKVNLDGSQSTPTGQVSYSWTLTQSPASSQETIDDPGAETTFFRPDVAGTYVIELAVTDLTTGQAGCVTDSITIAALAAPPELRVSATWQADHDLDLHVLRSDSMGGFPSFTDMVNDLYYDNLHADWGVVNDPSDDGFHFGDDTDGFGPEAAIVAVLEQGRKYRIGLQFARRDGFLPASFEATVTLDVDPGMGPAAQEVLQHTFLVSEVGTYWIPFDINGANGKITVVDTTQ